MYRYSAVGLQLQGRELRELLTSFNVIVIFGHSLFWQTPSASLNNASSTQHLFVTSGVHNSKHMYMMHADGGHFAAQKLQAITVNQFTQTYNPGHDISRSYTRPTLENDFASILIRIICWKVIQLNKNIQIVQGSAATGLKRAGRFHIKVLWSFNSNARVKEWLQESCVIAKNWPRDAPYI